VNTSAPAGLPKELGKSLNQKVTNGSHNRKDIVDKDVDYWVWEKADESVPPLANSRSNVAPKSDKYWENSARPAVSSIPSELGGLASKVAATSGLPAELSGLA
jgi:hypothetical protein